MKCKNCGGTIYSVMVSREVPVAPTVNGMYKTKWRHDIAHSVKKLLMAKKDGRTWWYHELCDKPEPVEVDEVRSIMDRYGHDTCGD